MTPISACDIKVAVNSHSNLAAVSHVESIPDNRAGMIIEAWAIRADDLLQEEHRVTSRLSNYRGGTMPPGKAAIVAPMCLENMAHLHPNIGRLLVPPPRENRH